MRRDRIIAPMARPLLLHSLVEHRETILGCLDAAAPRRVLEIGSETGAMTELLYGWALGHDADLVCVDPDPPAGVRLLAEHSPAIEVVRGASPWALEGLEPVQAAIIDGDHNYWTVSRELEAVERLAAGSASGWLAVLHDVGWPNARRDAYYAPERLPPDAVHPHRYDRGVVPGEPRLVKGGFRGEGAFAYAKREGGPRNGVLTAVEDFLAEREGFAFHVIPAVFGGGLLCSADQPWSARVAEIAAAAGGPLVERLEENRLALFVAFLDRVDEAQRLAESHRRTLAVLEQQIESLSADRARLRLAAARGGASDG
jgi:hypothetical protein